MKYVYVYIKIIWVKSLNINNLNALQNNSKLGSHLTGWITQELNYKK